MKRITILWAALVLAVPFAVNAREPAPGEALTFTQALRRALEANPATGQARTNVSEAEAQRRVARSSILPHVDLYGSATRNSDEITFGEGSDAVSILPQNDWKYSFQISQPVYAGGRELRAIRQAGLAIDFAKEGVRESEDFVLLNTAANYLGVVQGKALVDIEKKNLDLSRRRKEQADNFFEAGESTKVDVLRAETAIKVAERRVAGAEQMRDAAASRLRIDLAIDHPIAVAEPQVEFPPLPADEELLRLAEAQRPEVQQARVGHQIAQLETRKQRAGYLPIVTAQANIVHQKAAFPTDQYNALTLNLWLPVFESGQIESRIATARANEREAELRLEQAQRSTRESVQQALIDLRTSVTNLALAREQLAAAEAEYEQTFELYRSQEATALDVDTAESALAEARRAVVNGALDRDLAELRVWYAAGSLKQVVLREESNS